MQSWGTRRERNTYVPAEQKVYWGVGGGARAHFLRRCGTSSQKLKSLNPWREKNPALHPLLCTQLAPVRRREQARRANQNFEIRRSGQKIYSPNKFACFQRSSLYPSTTPARAPGPTSETLCGEQHVRRQSAARGRQNTEFHPGKAHHAVSQL